MSFKFNLGDFHQNPNAVTTVSTFVDKANALLEEYVKTLPVVYGCVGFWQQKEDMAGDTHTARLWGVSPIGEQEIK